MSQSWIEFWNWILNLTQNNLSQLFKSTVKIWAKLNIRNLVKNYPILQVWSWICGGHGSWFVLISFSLGQVSLQWKFELNWMSSCWEKFVWVGGGGGTQNRVTPSPFDFRLWTWTWIVTILTASLTSQTMQVLYHQEDNKIAEIGSENFAVRRIQFYAFWYFVFYILCTHSSGRGLLVKRLLSSHWNLFRDAN